MKMIIELPEKTIAHIRSEYGHGKGFYPLNEEDKKIVNDAIYFGTPLPKGHGRLIDLDALIEKEMIGGYMEIDEKDICNIPVIIKGTEKGKWLVDDGFRKIYKCPECGQIVMTNDIEVYRFCHGCGMKMEGVKYEQTE